MERNILRATAEDKKEILYLYQTMLNGPAGWDEDYPGEENIDFDLSRDALYIMKNEKDEIIATISIDQDEAVEALDCWSKESVPNAELARLCVRKDMQNRGIAKDMMNFIFNILREDGKKGVHILVKKGHKAALASYSKLGFKIVGECHLFEKDYVCMELFL